MQNATILLVEDEKAAADMLTSFLKLNQFNVLTAYDGNQALKLIEANSKTIQLAILDIMIPFIDGKELCKRIRNHPTLQEIPVIFLTAKDKERDEIEGLTIGADDYISKPASLNLVLAHVKSLLRRNISTQQSNQIEFAGVSVDSNSQEVFVENKRIELTATEFQILKLMFTSPKRIFSRQDILEQIMPEDHFVFDRTVDVHIKNIRIKLGQSGEIIKTYRGVGYGVNKDLAGL
jgi:DNA-binding response OmpR family regulator